MFAGQRMTELVQHLHDANRQPQPEDVLQIELISKDFYEKVNSYIKVE